MKTLTNVAGVECVRVQYRMELQQKADLYTTYAELVGMYEDLGLPEVICGSRPLIADGVDRCDDSCGTLRVWVDARHVPMLIMRGARSDYPRG